MSSFASLWGKQVSTEEPVTIATADLETPLVINRAALISGTEAIVNVEIEDKSFTLGTLRKEKKEQMHLELRFWNMLDETYKISVSGKNAKVDLTGYYLLLDEQDDGESFEEDSEDSADSLTNVMVEDVTEEEANRLMVDLDPKADKKRKGKAEKKKVQQQQGKNAEKDAKKPEEKPQKAEKKAAEKKS